MKLRGWMVALAAVMLPSACGGGDSQAVAPTTAKGDAKETAPAKNGKKSAGKKKNKVKHVGATADDDMPAGVITVDGAVHNTTGRVPVKPIDLVLDDIPVVEVPEPLDQKDAPAALPTSVRPAGLRVEKIDRGYQSHDAYGSAVYIVLEEPLGRLQIGTIADDRNASERVYRTCGDRYYNRPMLTPARWQTLSANKKGEAEFKIVDAWFDAQSCEASVVRETVVKPKAVLGSLLLVFRSECEDCLPKQALNFLAPPLGQLAANGVGGETAASHGSFTLIRLPLRRGGAASFTGQAQAHSVTRWFDALKAKSLGESDVFIGAEVQHAVADQDPIAITYATLVRR